ncbi:MAG: cupin domain-containing protein [Methylococcales bacterium]|nr:cupin domain-containing protein [Methylococcales bacterium]
MSDVIQPFSRNDEFYTPEKCYITELLNTVDNPDLSIARARVEPGITTCWHRLTATAEYYYILSGCGIMEVGTLPPKDVKTGDVVLIPPQCRQRITNTGTESLVFLAICTPRFLNEAYQAIEKD